MPTARLPFPRLEAPRLSQASASASAVPSPLARALSARLVALIQAEIAAEGGWLSFDRFMDLALYAPGLGYYVAGATKFGRAGDFVTAPDCSPLFGRCVALQCADVLDALDGGDIVELGAGSGALAGDILEQLAALGRLPDRYAILEVSPELRARQRACLDARLSVETRRRVHWLDHLPARLRGLAIANEVADALPVQRFAIDARGAPLELGVAADDATGGFREQPAAPRSSGLAAAIAELRGQGLADAAGYRSEISPRLAPWTRALAETLDAGLMLIIDYGYPRAEYYRPERHQGTLRCHYRQRAHDDPFAYPGLQDITAHVDFTALATAGRAAGLTLAGYTTQAHFLMGCGLDRLVETALGAVPDEGARCALLAGVKQLVLPAAMGERFKVIALARGLELDWRGFAVRDLSGRL